MTTDRYSCVDSESKSVPVEVGIWYEDRRRGRNLLLHALQCLEKMDARNKTEDAKLEVTKHVEAEKLEYKLIDIVHVSLCMPMILLTSPAQLG